MFGQTVVSDTALGLINVAQTTAEGDFVDNPWNTRDTFFFLFLRPPF